MVANARIRGAMQEYDKASTCQQQSLLSRGSSSVEASLTNDTEQGEFGVDRSPPHSGNFDISVVHLSRSPV